MVENSALSKPRTGERITTNTLDRQLDALGGQVFEFGVRSEETGKMMIRTWTRQKAVSSIRWLRFKNIRGHHIYLRPQGSSGVVLIDDISLGLLPKLEEDGVEAACIVETSPLNYQV